ncbi:unnamed protein product [Amoebophrya sp. A25]|nr:unnamed protein product [Amoebophrya sp. A25]|eukprot:GSA25T00001494001.1
MRRSSSLFFTTASMAMMMLFFGAVSPTTALASSVGVSTGRDRVRVTKEPDWKAEVANLLGGILQRLEKRRSLLAASSKSSEQDVLGEAFRSGGLSGAAVSELKNLVEDAGNLSDRADGYLGGRYLPESTKKEVAKILQGIISRLSK